MTTFIFCAVQGTRKIRILRRLFLQQQSLRQQPRAPPPQHPRQQHQGPALLQMFSVTTAIFQHRREFAQLMLKEKLHLLT
jgi:hypothetical protein